MRKRKSKPLLISIYTDGSCDPKSGEGAWAACWVRDEECATISGCVNQTTHQRMELTAVVEALMSVANLSRAHRCIVYTDSQYVMDLSGRKADLLERNFVSKKGSYVKNCDLLLQLFHVLESMDVIMIKVKAHEKKGPTNQLHRKVDQLSRKLVRETRVMSQMKEHSAQ